MPEHSTWFDFLIPGFPELLARFRELVGLSFLAHTPVELKYAFGFIFVGVIVLAMILAVRKRLTNVDRSLIPEGRLTIQSFLEAMVEGAINTMMQVMDRKAAIYFVPFIGTCAFMILGSNLLGLVPGFPAPTGTLNTTVPLALIVFFATHIYGVKEHGMVNYFKHWFGPIRGWRPDKLLLMIVMFGLECVSHLARPLSLSVRLAGNMFGGHLVIAIFVGFFPLFLPMPILLLKVVVCIIQTAVFCILASVYIGLAISHEEH